jgi:hypothetical protein
MYSTGSRGSCPNRNDEISSGTDAAPWRREQAPKLVARGP